MSREACKPGPLCLLPRLEKGAVEHVLAQGLSTCQKLPATESHIRNWTEGLELGQNPGFFNSQYYTLLDETDTMSNNHQYAFSYENGQYIGLQGLKSFVHTNHSELWSNMLLEAEGLILHYARWET